MSALQLLDSRSFRNKLDYFISVASRKRPKPTDDELAEALQPVLDAYAGAPAPMVAPSPMGKPLDDEERIIPQKERSIIDVMDGIISSFAGVVSNTPIGTNGIRHVVFPMDIPVSELTGYTNDKTDSPWFVDAAEMTNMVPNGGGWILPCRTR